MTYTELQTLVREYAKANPTQRFGQAAFNAVYESYPDTADLLRATEFDPFYSSESVQAFLYQALILINVVEVNSTLTWPPTA